MPDTQLPVPEENGGTKKKKKKKKKKDREREEAVSDDESKTTTTTTTTTATSEKSPETSLQNGLGLGEEDEKRKKKKKSKKKTTSSDVTASSSSSPTTTTTDGDSSSTSQLPSPEEQPRQNNDNDNGVKPLGAELAIHTGKGTSVTNNNNNKQNVTSVQGEGGISACEQGLATTSSSSNNENTADSTEDRIKTLLSEMAAIRANTERISTGMVSSLTVCEASSTRTRELRKPSSQALGLFDQVEAAQRQARMLKSRVDGVIRRNRVSADKLKEIQVIQSKREEEEEDSK